MHLLFKFRKSFLLLLLKKSELFFFRKSWKHFKSCVLSFLFYTSFSPVNMLWNEKRTYIPMICLIYFFNKKVWDCKMDNPQLLPHISTTTKGILVYGIYAHFLWLCHYTHTFVIDNPIFTKNVCFHRRSSDSWCRSKYHKIFFIEE